LNDCPVRAHPEKTPAIELHDLIFACRDEIMVPLRVPVLDCRRIDKTKTRSEACDEAVAARRGDWLRATGSARQIQRRGAAGDVRVATTVHHERECLVEVDAPMYVAWQQRAQRS
jgi:hypothetical protein